VDPNAGDEHEHKAAAWFREFNISNSVRAWFRIPAARGVRDVASSWTLL